MSSGVRECYSLEVEGKKVCGVFISVKPCRENQFVFPSSAPSRSMASGCSLGWLPFLLDRDKSLVLAEISESREDRKNCFI